LRRRHQLRQLAARFVAWREFTELAQDPSTLQGSSKGHVSVVLRPELMIRRSTAAPSSERV
jgi:hypothetical protein